MADDPQRPFATFNFLVELRLPDRGEALCRSEFAECDGIEISMAPKTIREGGNNHQPIRLLGPVSYGQLTLKRGMTRADSSLDLWRWFERMLGRDRRGYRATGTITLLDSSRGETGLSFSLSGCLPVKLKAPTLNAKDGQLAIEEMQIAYERLTLVAAEVN